MFQRIRSLPREEPVCRYGSNMQHEYSDWDTGIKFKHRWKIYQEEIKLLFLSFCDGKIICWILNENVKYSRHVQNYLNCSLDLCFKLWACRVGVWSPTCWSWWSGLRIYTHKYYFFFFKTNSKSIQKRYTTAPGPKRIQLIVRIPNFWSLRKCTTTKVYFLIQTKKWFLLM